MNLYDSAEPTDYADYRALNVYRQTLASLVARQIEIFRALGMHGSIEGAAKLRNRVLSDTFKILVLGEFRRGKSTFINALLRKVVLPALPIPTTAIINEVKWGEQPRALLHFRRSRDGTAPPPQEIPVDKLDEYVVIRREAGRDSTRLSKEIRENPYDKVELFWPLEICRNGVEIIDSPGLNEHEVRQRVTMDYLANVDAVVFVLMCGALGSISELSTIENVLTPSGHRDIFLVCNRFDQIRPEDRDLVMREGVAKLAPYTARGASRIFFVSALDALEGRLECDAQRVEESNLKNLEDALEDFLARERGRVKIIRPANELKTHIRELKKTLPQRVAMLRTDLVTLERRYARGKKRLAQLETDKDGVAKWLVEVEAALTAKVTDLALKFYEGIATDVPVWAQLYDGGSIDFLSLKSTKTQVEAIVGEMVNELIEKIHHAFGEWHGTVLQGELKRHMEIIHAELERRAGAFLSEIDSIRLEIAQGNTSRTTPLATDDVSPVERILNGIGTPTIDMPSMSDVGAALAAKDLLRSVFPQIAVGIVGVIGAVMAAMNPVGIIVAAMLGAGFFQAIGSGEKIKAKLQHTVGDRLAEQLKVNSRKDAESVAQVVSRGIQELARLVAAGLEKQLRDVREDVESVVEKKRQGEAKVESALAETATTNEALLELEEKLDDLITQVAVA